VDVNGDRVLNFSEFKRLMDLLRNRPELALMWNFLVLGGKSFHAHILFEALNAFIVPSGADALPKHNEVLGLGPETTIDQSYLERSIPAETFLEFWNSVQSHSWTLAQAEDMIGLYLHNRLTVHNFFQ
jgi:hypothetical protein